MIHEIASALMRKIGCDTNRRLFSVRYALRALDETDKTAKKGKKKAGRMVRVARRIRKGVIRIAKKLIGKVCSVLGSKCDGACSAAVNVITTIAKGYGIPLACASDVAKKACTTGCNAVC